MKKPILLSVLLALLLSSCKSISGELSTNVTTHTNTAVFILTSTPTPRPTKTIAPTPTITLVPSNTPSPIPTATPTLNLYQFNGYWLSPIEKGTGAYIQTYGNLCPEYLDGSDLSCIENWKGEKGRWPEDYWEILVCPHHVVEWDIAWDDWGEKVFAVQGGQIREIELEDDKHGVHFFIVDIKPDNSYGANYGHIEPKSLVENGIITEEQLDRILEGKAVDGGMVYEGQQLGVTGGYYYGSGGILHIGPVYGGFWDLPSYYTDPSELWNLGEWPDIEDSRKRESGNPCPDPYEYNR